MRNQVPVAETNCEDRLLSSRRYRWRMHRLNRAHALSSLSLRVGWTPGGRPELRVDAVGRFAIGALIMLIVTALALTCFATRGTATLDTPLLAERDLHLIGVRQFFELRPNAAGPTRTRVRHQLVRGKPARGRGRGDRARPIISLNGRVPFAESSRLSQGNISRKQATRRGRARRAF
jgi:hypothetical protein